MKRYLLPVISLLLLGGIVGVVLKFTLFKKSSAGLQVNSIPQATVFLDGKEVGKTPYEDSQLTSGEKNLKLMVSLGGEKYAVWEAKVKLNNGVLTLVNRELAEEESVSQGETITLEPIMDKKSASLTIISQPDSSLVKLGGEAKGFTPIPLEKLSPGEHEIIVSSPEFKERKIRTKLFQGYKTIINVKLAQLKEEKKDQAELTPTPGKTTPTPSIKTTPTGLPRPYVKILDTPTGWLRVRIEPSLSASESAKVNPGEQFPLLGEESGWYKISYGQGKEGWISGRYAEKYE